MWVVRRGNEITSRTTGGMTVYWYDVELVAIYNFIGRRIDKSEIGG